MFILRFAGADRANLTITIHPDDIPELDESFTVELANITGKNEKLRTGAVSTFIYSIFSIAFHVTVLKIIDSEGGGERI